MYHRPNLDSTFFVFREKDVLFISSSQVYILVPRKKYINQDTMHQWLNNNKKSLSYHKYKEIKIAISRYVVYYINHF